MCMQVCMTLLHHPYFAMGSQCTNLCHYLNDIILVKIMELGLKWVHMARYELILKLDGAIWLKIISKPLLTQK